LHCFFFSNTVHPYIAISAEAYDAQHPLCSLTHLFALPKRSTFRIYHASDQISSIIVEVTTHAVAAYYVSVYVIGQVFLEMQLFSFNVVYLVLLRIVLL